MPVTLIKQLPDFVKRVEGPNKLSISEMFVDTIQGEGVNQGHPATFIRLQGCTLKCIWCDTLDVWPYGNEYSFEEIIQMLLPYRDKYINGAQHIVLTGGSPLKQEKALYYFLLELRDAFGFKPYVECENEAVLIPNYLLAWVNTWNNSPKLSNSGMKDQARIKPKVLKMMSNIPNSWFKFVIRDDDDWNEIQRDFLPLIQNQRHSIVLMPEGQTQEELNAVREKVVEIAVREGVRYCDRLHVVIWNKKTGV